MSGWFERIQAALAASDRPVIVWPAGAGRLLISPFGARVLACEAPGVDGNLFWHGPQMEDASQPIDSVAGGDRLWIAPEVGFIFHPLDKAREDPIAYSDLPAAMDPGNWDVLVDEPGRTALQTEMTLTDHRFDATVSLRVTREFFAIQPPQGVPDSLTHCGFGIRNQLTRLQMPPGAVAGAWDLLQLPPTGTLICPTVRHPGTPRSYYEPFGDKHVQVDDRRVRFLIDGGRRIKMGLRAELSTGRLGYYRRVGDVATLIVRCFHSQPGRPYVDVPRDTDDVFGGDAVQAYNDDGTFGGFGEMEHHDPALTGDGSMGTVTGESVTHVLIGEDGLVRGVGEALLGAAVEPIE